MSNQYNRRKLLLMEPWAEPLSWRKQLMTLVLMCLISACSSPLKIAGEKHRVATQKWKALSNYTSSELPNLGFTVTAKLGLTIKENKTELDFSEIKLATQANRFSLDLLTPDFKDKYMCKPMCFQFTEYESRYSEQGKTLLDRYLTQQEFKLFSFYSYMFVLNDALLTLQQENSELLYYYLDFLILVQEDVSSLEELTAFLDKHLSIDNYRAFITNPHAQYRSMVNQSFSKDNSNPSVFAAIKPDENWNDKLLMNDPSNNWNTSEIVDPTNDWDTSTNVAEQQVWLKFAVRNPANSNWIVARNRPLKVGELVCSYSENYFGNVEVTSGNQVNVFLQGQVQQYVDGTLTNYKPGILFEPVENIVFLPLAESRLFDLQDVAPCDIQYN